MTRGRFMTLEGVEGCGKSTQARRVADAMVQRGLAVAHVREPGGTALAEDIRKVLLDSAHAGMTPESELLLYLAARADHVRRIIEPALAAGTHVVCDRFSDSTRAYQGAGRGLDAAIIESADRVARGNLVPDVTLLLDVPVEVGLARARGRNAVRDAAGAPDEGRFEAEDLAFHRRVRSAFLRLAGAEPERIWVIDASGEEEDVARRVDEVLKRAFPELAAG